MTEEARAVYLSALADIRLAPGRGERAAIVKHAARILDVSGSTVWRNLKKLGWDSGRTRRTDAGCSAVSNDGLVQLSAIMAKGRNKRGQPNVPLSEAHRIAQELELEAGQVSYGQALRLMNQAGLGPRHLRAPEACVARVSQHPNHVWQFDISVAIQWYFRDEKTGKKLRLYDDAGARFYEGKRQNLAKVRQVLHRFVMTDHYSGAWYAQYYYTPGERWEEVADFLYRCMSPKALGDSFPLRGVPRRLVMDQGPANKSAYITNLLEELDVRIELHRAKNAKASGSVETRHNHWQRSFEGRLALQPARDLAELNRNAEAMCALAAGERVHRRHGRPPLELWATIQPEQLVECPDRDVFFQLAASSPRTGVLNANHYLRANNRTWLIRGDHVHARQRVRYRLTPFVSNGVRVWDQHGRELSAEEVHLNEAGFPTTGRFHVWDDAAHPGATAPSTPAQTIAAEVVKKRDERDLDVDLDLDVFGDLERRARRRAYLNTRGQDWAAQDSALSASPVVPRLEALEEIVRRLGRGLGADGPWWRERIGDGLTTQQLDQAWDEFVALEVAAGGRNH